MWPLLKRGISWKLGADLLGRLMQYLLLWLAAHKLGLAEFGDFTFALGVGYMISQVADFGLQLYVQRELARLAIPGAITTPYFTDEREAARLVGGGLVIKAALSAVSIALITAVVLWEPVGNKWPVLLVGLATVGLTSLDYLAYCFRALGKLNEEARAYIAGRGTNLLLGVVLLQAGATLWGLAIAACIAALLAVGYSYRRLLRYLRPVWRVDVSYWRRVLLQPLAIGMGIVLSMVAFRVDNLLIPLLVRGVRADESLSIYNAAYKLFELTLILPATVLAAVFAFLSKAASERGNAGEPDAQAHFKRVLRRLVLALVSLGALSCMALGLGAVPLIHLLYGDNFAASATVLQLLALGCLPMYASYGLTHALIALNKPKAYAWAAFAALITNLGANLLLLPRMGIAGAALATLCTELVMVALCGLATLWALRRGDVPLPTRKQAYNAPPLEEAI